MQPQAHYILDLIADIILRDKEFGSNKIDIQSKILSSSITNDFLIGRVCEREIIKLENTYIDDQLEFFINLAVKYNGEIALKSLNKLTQIHQSKNNSIIQKFMGHPIVTTSENTLYFRYDFFTEYFKNLYISKFLATKNIDNIDLNLINIMGDYIRYDNSFTEYVCKRTTFDDDLYLFIMELIGDQQIKSKFDEIDLRRLSSSLLILLLVNLRLSSSENSIDTRTKLIKEIFGKETIENLCILNLFTGECAIKPIFDLTNINLRNCWFENYEYFWECKIDETTLFFDSVFKCLEPRKGIKPLIHSNMFDDDCDITEIEHLIKDVTEESEQKKDALKSELIMIIRYFEKSGTFQRKNINGTRSKFNSRTIDKLIRFGVIDDSIDKTKPTFGKQYSINENYQNLMKVLEQGGSYLEFERGLNLLHT